MNFKNCIRLSQADLRKNPTRNSVSKQKMSTVQSWGVVTFYDWNKSTYCNFTYRLLIRAHEGSIYSTLLPGGLCWDYLVGAI